jgi:hypothetical protein
MWAQHASLGESAVVEASPAMAGVPVSFPVDVSVWTGRPQLLEMVEAAAACACGASWLDLAMEPQGSLPSATDDLLVLTTYCYLSGVFHSPEVTRRLDGDAVLAGYRGRLVLRGEQVRGFRREHRRMLADCLTRTLMNLWDSRHPTAQVRPAGWRHLLEDRRQFTRLEPFYLQAQERIDRAVVLDSMAMDD